MLLQRAVLHSNLPFEVVPSRSSMSRGLIGDSGIVLAIGLAIITQMNPALHFIRTRIIVQRVSVTIR
jgi:hypothetical protein